VVCARAVPATSRNADIVVIIKPCFILSVS
jgi:hypothetical protein